VWYRKKLHHHITNLKETFHGLEAAYHATNFYQYFTNKLFVANSQIEAILEGTENDQATS
jgi:biopolymer transport protein ExbB/TolQ